MPECNSQFLRAKKSANKENRLSLTTPTCTPGSVRKSKRRSKLFTSLGKEEERCDVEEVGSGRSIPVRQGYLYKKSSGSFSKEWKKKYVTLCNDSVITLHPSFHDYMENIHGKEIPLQCVTVKVPGQAPRGSSIRAKDDTASDCICKHASDTPGVKKRTRRRTESVNGCVELEVEPFEFQIICLNAKKWHFEAGSASDRDKWVQAIEQQILSCLQENKTNKAGTKTISSLMDHNRISQLKSDIRGNSKCVDCDSPNPDWASLNLGVLVCIECSGIHRNLGSHISRVRSLDLDEWPPGHLAVMNSLGNYIANSVWEARTPPGHRKPGPDSSREDKERYIQAKYDRKEWIASLPSPHSPAQALVDAICRCDMAEVSLALSHCKQEEVNSPVSPRDARTPLHLAAALGNLPIAQLLIWVG